MNCCNAFGQCQGGRDCPARTAATPAATTLAGAPHATTTPADDELENELADALVRLLVTYACIAIFAGLIGFIVGLGYSPV